MLDPGIGKDGKDGQGVHVGVGQPTLLINDLTVRGTYYRVAADVRRLVRGINTRRDIIAL